MANAAPIVLSFELSENSMDALAERIALKTLELAGMSTPTKTPESAPEASQELQEGSETGAGRGRQTSPAQGTSKEVTQDEADPWVGGGAATSTAAPTASAPANTVTGPQVVTKDTQYGPIKYELSLNNAPTCMHGNRAARVTKTKRAGGTYQKWVCAKDAGSDWKSKCDFEQWV